MERRRADWIRQQLFYQPIKAIAEILSTNKKCSFWNSPSDDLSSFPWDELYAVQLLNLKSDFSHIIGRHIAVQNEGTSIPSGPWSGD